MPRLGIQETNRIATISRDKTRKIIEPEIAAYERNMMASNAMVEDQLLLFSRGQMKKQQSCSTTYSSFAACNGPLARTERKDVGNIYQSM